MSNIVHVLYYFGTWGIFRLWNSGFRANYCIMSKEESTILKGVAILLMLFLHLFNKTNLSEICQPLLFVGDQPLVHILSRAANPVAFFIILSGYGLRFVYDQGKLDMKSQGRRLLKLYIHYWLILFVFVSIGSYVHPETYPGDIWKIIGNLTSWNNTYNYETWFLFPYAVISLCAFPIFKLMDKIGNVRSLLLFFCISFACAYITSRYIAVYKLYDSMLAHIITPLGFLFGFGIGAVMCRISAVRPLRIKHLEGRGRLTILLLLLLVTFRCLFDTSAFHTIYVFFFILLFLHIPLHRIVKMFLVKMGEHSMPMWMIHTFFSNYIFREFIWGFQYPLVIYIVLLTISYACSIPIMKCAKRIC